MVEIIPFSNHDALGRRLLRQFVQFHWNHYANEPKYVPLLDYEYLGSKVLGITGLFESRNHFFKSAEARFFLALKNGNVVGRCAAFVNRSHNLHWNDRVGFFGHFESRNDPDVSKALLSSAEDWIRDQRMNVIRGPQNFPINKATPGVLLEGFESRPVLYYHYNFPYYQDLLTQAGYKQVMKIKSFEVPCPDNPIETNLGPICRTIIEKNGIHFERWSERRRSIRIEELHSIYNDAWSDNFGFIPFTRQELYKIIDGMQLLNASDMFSFAYVNDEAAGVFVAVPNIFEVIALRKNLNRLELVRAIKLMASLGSITGLRLGYLGVKKKFRNMGLDAALLWQQNQTTLKQGYKYIDVGWILETNKPTLDLIESCGGIPSKTYGIYEKAI
jgi:hypothetical protein